MKKEIGQSGTVLLAGNENLTWSIAACLLKAGHSVNLWTNDMGEPVEAVHAHVSGMKAGQRADAEKMEHLQVSGNLKEIRNCGIAIMITPEELSVKQAKIRQLEEQLSSDTIIGINSESIGLDVLQQHAGSGQRIIGLNWVEPAHTTRFLEIISNPAVEEGVTDHICNLASSAWKKDPYIVQNFGIRSKLISAMVREAFYLVESGYASVEDIDRACRNDAGYYLPFAGNCRYMDLMGTNGYGMVMKDLNPHLSKEQQVPVFFADILKEGGIGILNGRGLYNYTEAEVKRWKNTMDKFSYQIEEIINKYPFNYNAEKSH